MKTEQIFIMMSHVIEGTVPRGNTVRLTASKMRSLPLSIGSAACHSRLVVLNTVPT